MPLTDTLITIAQKRLNIQIQPSYRGPFICSIRKDFEKF